MRKALLGLLLVLTASAGLWLALRDDAPAPSRPAVESSAAPQRSPAPAREAKVAPQEPLRPDGRQGGELAGKVVGPGSAGARVALEGARSETVVAGADGSFRFARLPPGAYHLDASGGGLAAETLGPIPLGPGEEIRGLVLALVETGSLAGEVLDASTHAPLVGAVLTAGGAAATTDDRGQFELRGLPPGAAVLKVAHPGYVPSRSQVAVPRGKAQTGATLLLVPAARVSGVVKLSDGSPVAGAPVVALRYGFGAGDGTRSLGETDAQGAFRGELEAGSVTLVASAPVGEARSGELELRPGEARGPIELTVDVGGEISGLVLDAMGAPAAGAVVSAVDAETARAFGPSQTGSDGRFDLAGLPVGTYALVARLGAQVATRAGVRVEKGGTATAELHLAGQVLAGRVVDARGQPLVGAQVQALPEGAPELAAQRGESGAEGRFRLRGLAGSRFTLRATHASGSAELHGLAAGSSEVELRISAQSGLAGVVFDEAGHAVTDFRVVADPLLSPGLPGAGRAMGHFASVAGTFHLPLAPGRYRLRVAALGYAAADAGEVEAPERGESSEIRVTLKRARSISGQVLDARTRKPIAGARVATRPILLFAFGRTSPVPGGAYAAADPEGRFTLMDAPPEDTQLFAAADGYEGSQPVSVAATSAGPVEILLQPGGQGSPESFAGVGMALNGDFRVTEAFDSGPAYLAGIRVGDQLLTVDGTPVAGHPLTDVIQWIRGASGTPVALGLSRNGQPFVVVPTRAEVKF